MAEFTFYIILALACAGFLGLVIAPRDKMKKYKPREDIYEGLDDYALLIRLVEEGRYKKFSTALSRIIRGERNPERRRVLRVVEGEVTKWLRKQ